MAPIMANAKKIPDQNKISIFSASYLLRMLPISMTNIPKAILIATRNVFSNSFTSSIFPYPLLYHKGASMSKFNGSSSMEVIHYFT